jgi:hypothetical protein
MISSRLVLVTMFAISAVFAVSGFAAGSASAFAPCVHEPTAEHSVLCVEEPGQSPATLLLVSVDITFAGDKEAGTSSSFSTPELGINIVCEEVDKTGTLEPEGASTGLLVSNVLVTFKQNCIDVENESECEVKEPITTKALTATLSLMSSRTLDVSFRPTTGTVLTLITVKSKTGESCGQAIEQAKVTGLQSCEGYISSEEDEDETYQLVYCPPDPSELLFAHAPTLLDLEEELWLTEKGFEHWLWGIISGS